MTDSRPTYCVIVAAGSGSRFGSDLPKQFCPLGGRPVLMTTIERAAACLPPGSEIVVVLSEGGVGLWEELCREHRFVSPRTVIGGATRWESVRNAIDSMPQGMQLIMVTDGARPLIEPDVVARLYQAVEGDSIGAVPAIDLSDSIRQRLESGETEAADRSRFCAVQTPQLFPAAMLREAYALPYSPLFTDDASVEEAFTGRRVSVVAGSPRTLKITHPADIAVAEFYLRQNG